MKKGDTLFKEQFIILHDDDDGELIVKRSDIDVLKSHYGSTYVHLKGGASFYVHESVDEILKLL